MQPLFSMESLSRPCLGKECTRSAEQGRPGRPSRTKLADISRATPTRARPDGLAYANTASVRAARSRSPDVSRETLCRSRQDPWRADAGSAAFRRARMSRCPAHAVPPPAVDSRPRAAPRPRRAGVPRNQKAIKKAGTFAFGSGLRFLAEGQGFEPWLPV